DLEQTVDADGTLAATRSAAATFPVDGTVGSVDVAVGQKVKAGQKIATLDRSSLRSAVSQARTTLAQARSQLANDRQAQINGTSSTSTTTTTTITTDSAVRSTSRHRTHIVLAAAHIELASSTSSDDGIAAVKQAQRAVVRAQHGLDTAISAQDTAVATLQTSCAASDDATPITSKVTPAADGSITGSAGSSAVVATLLDSNGSTVSSQRVAAGASYSFTGLDTTAEYTLEIERASVIDTSDCQSAVRAVSSRQDAVDGRQDTLDDAITTLSNAVSQLKSAPTSSPTSPTSGPTTGSSQPTSPPTSGSGSGAPTDQPSGSGAPTDQPSGSGAPTDQPSGSGIPTDQPSGSGAPSSGSLPSGSEFPSGSESAPASEVPSSGDLGGSTGTPVTAAQIAADVKTIDADLAALAVARHDLHFATLTSPISGTVAEVDIKAGDTVSASNSSQAITVVGKGALSIDLTVSLADVDLVKVGDGAKITVDGHTKPLVGTVTVVGATNTSSSTGSSSTYAVTVELDRINTSLLDGMGATAAIEVGHTADALSVPLSAVHTTGTSSTVQVYDNGTVTSKQVELGVEGASRVQITSGLTAGDQVVLANIDEAIPSSNDDSSTGFGGSGLTGGLTGGLGGSGGGPPSGFGGGGFSPPGG
ncbi:MAG: efflux RND transporter periplasmic adaptor subunit, partial [Williamsia herbipolensis]|nr:efflux RND transporter periplasmic adaptor subunit [Williamsia herbipolensis]